MKAVFFIVLFLLTTTVKGQMVFIDDAGEVKSGLQEMALEKSSFQKDSIIRLLTLLEETPHPDFRGLVVIEKNKLVLEKHYNTYWRITVHDIRSAGKSITGLLLGITVRHGLIHDLNRSVYSFFPKSKYPMMHEDYKKFTLQHLLDMSSGLDADTNNTATLGHAVHWMSKDSWLPYILNVPLTNVPGEKWSYADIHAVLIGAIIEEVSGLSLYDFAKQYLFQPLNIKQTYWFTNNSNQTGAAGNLYITTLDFAKLGLLVSNNGNWDGQQLIDKEFLRKLQNRTLDVSSEMGEGTYYGML